MSDFTWDFFKQTGNIDVYLLLKQFENEDGVHEQIKEEEEEIQH
jgi:hypothetical protein